MQAVAKNAEPMAHDIAQQILKPAAAAAQSADPAAQQFTEEGVKPAAKIIADNVQPVAKGFTDQTLLPTAQKVCRALCCLLPSYCSVWPSIQGHNERANASCDGCLQTVMRAMLYQGFTFCSAS